MQAAYEVWLATHQADGTLATGVAAADGAWEVVHADAEPADLASVGKSITAMCTAQLVKDGLLAWSDTLSDILGDAPDVTIAELVTHSSGLGPDATQTAMPLWLDQGQGVSQHFGAQVLDLVNARDDQSGQRGTYLYNNENYALLGLVIEAVTEAPYFQACQARLNLHDSIAPSPRASEFQPWGGLVASPAIYLAFLHQHFGPDSAVGDDPFAYPHVAMGGGAYYGLGTVFRRFGEGYNFWHFGALCFPGRFTAGSYAVIWEGRLSAVALYDACVDWDAMVGLDRALTVAAFGGSP